jgi:hypothetical protein
VRGNSNISLSKIRTPDGVPKNKYTALRGVFAKIVWPTFSLAIKILHLPYGQQKSNYNAAV